MLPFRFQRDMGKGKLTHAHLCRCRYRHCCGPRRYCYCGEQHGNEVMISPWQQPFLDSLPYVCIH